MKDFFGWLHEQNEAIPYFGGSPTPASNEVIRTGRQPQVDSGFEDGEKQEVSNDALLALDGQMQRLNLVVQDICDNNKLADCDALKQGFKQFAQVYRKVRDRHYTHPEYQAVNKEPTLPNRVPNDQQRAMMQAQQPPRSEYPPIGGGVSDFTNTM